MGRTLKLHLLCPVPVCLLEVQVESHTYALHVHCCRDLVLSGGLEQPLERIAEVVDR